MGRTGWDTIKVSVGDPGWRLVVLAALVVVAGGARPVSCLNGVWQTALGLTHLTKILG